MAARIDGDYLDLPQKFNFNIANGQPITVEKISSIANSDVYYHVRHYTARSFDGCRLFGEDEYPTKFFEVCASNGCLFSVKQNKDILGFITLSSSVFIRNSLLIYGDLLLIPSSYIAPSWQTWNTLFEVGHVLATRCNLHACLYQTFTCNAKIIALLRHQDQYHLCGTVPKSGYLNGDWESSMVFMKPLKNLRNSLPERSKCKESIYFEVHYKRNMIPYNVPHKVVVLKTGETAQLMPGKKSDIPACSRFLEEQRKLDATFSEEDFPSEEYLLENYELHKAAGILNFMAILNGRMVAMFYIKRSHLTRSSQSLLHDCMFVVAKEHRNSGLGHKIIEYAKEVALLYGYDYHISNTYLDNPSIQRLIFSRMNGFHVLTIPYGGYTPNVGWTDDLFLVVHYKQSNGATDSKL